MNSFWKSDTYAVIKAMKATGNRPGVIAEWIVRAGAWASANDGPDAVAVRAWLPLWQVRPFYSAAELAPIFPVLAWMLGGKDRLPPTMSPERLAFQLDYGGLPRLEKPDLSTHYRNPVTGQTARYYIVEEIHRWSKQPVTQEEFENVLLG